MAKELKFSSKLIAGITYQSTDQGRWEPDQDKITIVLSDGTVIEIECQNGSLEITNGQDKLSCDSWKAQGYS